MGRTFKLAQLQGLRACLRFLDLIIKSLQTAIYSVGKYAQLKKWKTGGSKNKTEILSGDALVWTAVFIDWIDLSKLIHYSFELIVLTLFVWLVDWMKESNISYVHFQNPITYDWKMYEIFDLSWSY